MDQLREDGLEQQSHQTYKRMPMPMPIAAASHECRSE